MNPDMLKKLWEQRKGLISRLQSQSFVTEGREPTYEEKTLDERMSAELKELDAKVQKGMDDLEREQRNSDQMQRYEKLTSGGTPERPTPDILLPTQSMTEWAQKKGMFEGSEQRSFDGYIRDLVHGKVNLEERALGEGGSAGAMVPTPVATQVIDLARNRMRVVQAGAVTVPMDSQTLKVPRLTAEGTPAWHAENTAIVDADLTFDSVTFTARTLTRLVKISIELVEDAPSQSEGVIADSFASQVALEVDRVALRGSGTAPEPRGVLNQSGVTITTHGVNGALITNYDFWLDAKGVVMGNNFEPNAHLQAPRSNTSLSKLKEATTNAYLAPPANMLPMLATKQIPINLTVGTSVDCSELYTAQWDQLLIGMRTELQILPLRERYIDNGQYGFLAWLRADVQLAQPSAFVVDTGVRA